MLSRQQWPLKPITKPHIWILISFFMTPSRALGNNTDRAIHKTLEQHGGSHHWRRCSVQAPDHVVHFIVGSTGDSIDFHPIDKTPHILGNILDTSSMAAIMLKISQVRFSKTWISDMKYSEDGRLLAVASSGGQIYIHDAMDHYALKATTSECRSFPRSRKFEVIDRMLLIPQHIRDRFYHIYHCFDDLHIGIQEAEPKKIYVSHFPVYFKLYGAAPNPGCIVSRQRGHQSPVLAQSSQWAFLNL